MGQTALTCGTYVGGPDVVLMRAGWKKKKGGGGEWEKAD